jgi:hypothetical protein
MEGQGDWISSNRVDHVANLARGVVLLFYLGYPAGAGTRSRRKQAMRRITRDDVSRTITGADDATIAQIIGTGATVDELAEALAWMANDEPMMNAGRPLATGRARELVDILAELEPDDDDDGRGAPASSVSQE